MENVKRLMSVELRTQGTYAGKFITEVLWYDGKGYRGTAPSIVTRLYPVRIARKLDQMYGSEWGLSFRVV